MLDVDYDFWNPNQHFVLEEMQSQSKARADTVEGCDSWFGHFLARLRYQKMR